MRCKKNTGEGGSVRKTGGGGGGEMLVEEEL
jgi:hypothetical protein